MLQRHSIRLVILLILAIIVFAASFFLKTGQKNILPTNNNSNGKIKVTTSFYPFYFFASRIAGDKADVYNVTPAGAEPHDYEPTAQDVARLEDSKLVVLSGAKLEAWGDRIKESLQGKDTLIVTVGDTLANQQVVENGATIQDPHVWLDPLLAKNEASSILRALQQIDPANTAYYQAHFERLANDLDSLHQEYLKGLGTCAQKNIITSHAAFGYLAREYRLEQVAISGLSPDEEPSSQKLAQVADFAKKNNVHYIFFENLVSPKLSETIAQEIGAQTLVLDPIEGLSDEQIKQGLSYFTQMRQNLTNLQIALECR